mmetsp:Transcript_35705/g.60180  ORF Transcript_35705/g.60180 Transcript_35705/m.60180 type:complete len:209 (-) Transcript_35705:547-1173(-)
MHHPHRFLLSERDDPLVRKLLAGAQQLRVHMRLDLGADVLSDCILSAQIFGFAQIPEQGDAFGEGGVRLQRNERGLHCARERGAVRRAHLEELTVERVTSLTVVIAPVLLQLLCLLNPSSIERMVNRLHHIQYIDTSLGFVPLGLAVSDHEDPLYRFLWRRPQLQRYRAWLFGAFMDNFLVIFANWLGRRFEISKRLQVKRRESGVVV